MKLALGTVQFGLPYGINNCNGIPDDKELKLIFETAYDSGIRIIDTASAYGNAEQRIAELSNNDYNIVTKFSEVYNQTTFKEKLTTSLNSLNAITLYGYIAHNANDLIQFPEIWSYLLWAKNDARIVKKIGYSLYNTEQLDKLLEMKFIPDLVQLPYSILDRKFEGYFSELKKMNVEIHIRSVFLQGLYFMSPNDLPVKLMPLQADLRNIHQICEKYEIPVASLALNYVCKNNDIDTVVMGVETCKQLQFNLDLMNFNLDPLIIDYINEIKIAKTELLHPGNWRD